MAIDRSPSPATSIPVIAPDRNAVVRPPCSDTRDGFRRADIGAHRNVHADIAGDPDSTAPIRNATVESPPSVKNRIAATTDADHRDSGVLPAQIGLGALLNGGGDILHLGVARRLAQHLAGGERAVQYGDHAAQHGKVNGCHLKLFPCRDGRATPAGGRADMSGAYRAGYA